MDLNFHIGTAKEAVSFLIKGEHRLLAQNRNASVTCRGFQKE
jgi:hypothetical protein